MAETFPLTAHKTWSGEVPELSLGLMPQRLWGLGMSVGSLGIARDPPSAIHLSRSTRSQMKQSLLRRDQEKAPWLELCLELMRQ